LIIDSGDGFVDSLKAALMKLESKVQVTVTSPNAKPEGNFNTLLLNGSLAVDAPEWVRSFNGSRVVVENETKDLCG
jgi:hypothetical protein